MNRKRAIHNVLWIAQFFRLPAAEFKGSKVPRIQDLKDRLLREEGRRRAVVFAGTREPEGVEHHPVAAEAEDRR